MPAGTATMPELDAQYRAMREGAGLLDRSERGKLVVSGPDAIDYLQGQLTNDLEQLAPGDGCYAALLDRKAHVLADARVLLLEREGGVWLDTEPVARERLAKHLMTYRVGREVEVSDVSGERTILSLLGPAAAELVATGPLSPEHAQRAVELGGAECLAVATADGLDLICDAGAAVRVGGALLEAGAAPVTEPAAEILRVEAGRPRYGREITEETMPAEAGIVERAVSFEKGCYIGQEPVARLHHRGRPNRRLCRLRLSEPVEAGATVRLDEREVGSIGTAVVSPRLGPIALAVIRREAEPGDALAVGAGGARAEIDER
jgi:folate-binding protein YgfZ